MEISGNIFKTDLPLKGLTNPFPAEGVAGYAPSGLPGAGGFGETLEKAIASVDNKLSVADDTAARFAAGENIEIHTVVIAAEQARLAVTLAAEVRNKMLEAYQELTRAAG
jgi:flagellar hook-basal body complex protein FliE